MDFANTNQHHNHYDTLGVDYDADIATIKNAYRELLLKHHPDKTGSHAHSHIVSQVQVAYAVLSDSQARKQYDYDLRNNNQSQGFVDHEHLEGLDTFSLDEFEFVEDYEHDRVIWQKHCPRCNGENLFMLSDWDLEHNGKSDNRGGYLIVVQCGACSLMIKVKYYDLDDD